MKNPIDWNFVPSLGAREEGIHNPMIEHFTGNYNYHLAREIIQNSLDAKLNGVDDSVLVTFDLIEIDKSDFPGYEKLLKVFGLCNESWKGDKEAEDFFKNAVAIMQKESIPFLKISDFNTKGLSGGDNEKKGSWHSLVKSSGSSSKTGGEGGSYGIGKGAPFAASNLRTVFYSTYNQSAQSIFQGLAELVSFSDEGTTTRGIGSYGIGQESIRKLELLALNEKFWRKKDPGTDIFIAGYKASRDWKEQLIKSVLRNFWYAISQNDLRVKIGNEEISRNTLEHYLVHHFQKEPFKDYIKPTGNPLQYYRAVKEGKPFINTDMPLLKSATFYFTETPEHMNYVAFMRRSHMVIYTKRYTFQGNFAGVFICDNEGGNKLLRVMEPPAHDVWDAERLSNGGDVLDEIKDFIRGSLDSMREKQSGSILEIPELNKVLPYDDEDNSKTSQNGKEYTGMEGKEETAHMIPQKMVFEKRNVITPYRVSVFNTPTTGDSDEGEGAGERSGKERGKKGNKGGGTGNKKSVHKERIRTRSFLVSESANKLFYRVVIKSAATAKINLKINAVGEVDQKDKVEISKALGDKGGKYHVSGNQIHNVDIIGGIPTIIDFEIKSPIKYAIKLEHNAI